MKISGLKIGKIAGLKTKPKILLGICAPMVLLLILGGVSVYSINTIVETNERVDHTHVVLGEAAAIVSSAVDMETGMRGYLLAGQEGFLDPYRGGEEATYSGITALQETVNDNPAQVERLAEVERVLREWQEKVTEPTIALRREIGDAETMNDMAALVGEARGKVYFDKFREQIATFIGREATLLSERRSEFQIAQSAVGENFGLVQETTGWVDHTHEVLAAAAQLLADAVDMETGMRGYLLAGEESFLDPYNAGKAAFFEGMAALQKTVDDNPAQVKRLEETETIIRDWVEKVTEPAIALRREVSAGERPLQAIQALISRQEGKKYFDAFRVQIAAFSQVERNLMAERQETAAGAGTRVSADLQVMNQNEEWVTTGETRTSCDGFLTQGVNEMSGPSEQEPQGGRTRDGWYEIRTGTADSARVYTHPRLMGSPQTRMNRLKAQLRDKKRIAMGAILGAIELLEETDQEPFPNFQENMIAEFESLRRELEALDTARLANAERFVSIGRRLERLSATLALLIRTDEHETVWRSI